DVEYTTLSWRSSYPRPALTHGSMVRQGYTRYRASAPKARSVWPQFAVAGHGWSEARSSAPYWNVAAKEILGPNRYPASAGSGIWAANSSKDPPWGSLPAGAAMPVPNATSIALVGAASSGTEGSRPSAMPDPRAVRIGPSIEMSATARAHTDLTSIESRSPVQ